CRERRERLRPLLPGPFTVRRAGRLIPHPRLTASHGHLRESSGSAVVQTVHGAKLGAAVRMDTDSSASSFALVDASAAARPPHNQPPGRTAAAVYFITGRASRGRRGCSAASRYQEHG